MEQAQTAVVVAKQTSGEYAQETAAVLEGWRRRSKWGR
jgi:delta-aminolevulinic acid dehydratase/porphobilinogen synthase